jgi:hypothetical protein
VVVAREENKMDDGNQWIYMDETARRPAIYRHRPPALSPYFSDRPSS